MGPWEGGCILSTHSPYLCGGGETLCPLHLAALPLSGPKTIAARDWNLCNQHLKLFSLLFAHLRHPDSVAEWRLTQVSSLGMSENKKKLITTLGLLHGSSGTVFFVKQDKKIVSGLPHPVIKIKHTRTKYTDSVLNQGKYLVSQIYSWH